MYFSTQFNMQELYDTVSHWYNKSEKLTRLCIFPFIDVVLQSLPLHYAYKLYRVFDFVYPDACYSRRFEINAQFKMCPYLIEDNPRVLLEYVDGLVAQNKLDVPAQNEIVSRLADNAFVNCFRIALLQDNLVNDNIHWTKVLHHACVGGNLEIVQLCIERVKIEDTTLAHFIRYVYAYRVVDYRFLFKRSIFEWFYDKVVDSFARHVDKYFALHALLSNVERLHAQTLWQCCPYEDDEPYPSTIRQPKHLLWNVSTHNGETQLLKITIRKQSALYKYRWTALGSGKAVDELVSLPYSFFD